MGSADQAGPHGLPVVSAAVVAARRFKPEQSRAVRLAAGGIHPTNVSDDWLLMIGRICAAARSLSPLLYVPKNKRGGAGAGVEVGGRRS